MKNIFKSLLLIIAMATFSASVNAQPNNKEQMTREQLAQTQARYIAKEMAMDEATSEKFISTFCDFQKEIWALGPRLKHDTAGSSEAETEEALKARFEHSQNLLNLRQKYYKEYSKFLTQKQIEQVYKLEKEMMDRMAHRQQNPNPRKGIPHRR